MEERKEPIEQETPGYIPRPKWQVVLAWIGLVVFIVFLVMFYIVIFRGGL